MDVNVLPTINKGSLLYFTLLYFTLSNLPVEYKVQPHIVAS